MARNNKQVFVLSTLLGATLFGLAQQAPAHTTIADNTLMEGKSVYTAATIPHGCDGSPVRAQGILFPVGANPVAVDGNGSPVDLSQHLNGVESGGGIPLGPRFIQDKNTFRTVSNVDDADTNRVGVAYDYGYLQADLTAWVPFRITTPTFLSTSCADTLVIRVPIVNHCNKSASAPNRIDAWIGRLTTKYNDPAVVSVNFWPTITVQRDLENNPLPESCAAGIQLDVSPSDDAIDNYLGVPGYWPNI